MDNKDLLKFKQDNFQQYTQHEKSNMKNIRLKSECEHVRDETVTVTFSDSIPVVSMRRRKNLIWLDKHQVKQLAESITVWLHEHEEIK